MCVFLNQFWKVYVSTAYLVGVRSKPVENGVEATITLSLALYFPRALSKHRVGGRVTLDLGGQSFSEQGSRIKKDPQVIDAAEGVVIKRIVKVLGAVYASDWRQQDNWRKQGGNGENK